jgi:hypothetical protein
MRRTSGASRRNSTDSPAFHGPDHSARLTTAGNVRPDDQHHHGIHRAATPERRTQREAFVEELVAAVAIYRLTTDIAKVAGKLAAEQQKRGIVIRARIS